MSGAGLTLPPAGSGISDQTVAFAAELMDRSGKAPVIEAALAHRTGRRRPLPARAVLTALLCLALDDRPLFLSEATRLLYHQISDVSRALLGVTGTAAGRRGFLAACRRVRLPASLGDRKWFRDGPFTVLGRASLCSLALIAAGSCERPAGSGGAERPRSGAAGALDAAGRERIMAGGGQGSEPRWS